MKRKEEKHFKKEISLLIRACYKEFASLGPGGLAASAQFENLLEMQSLEPHPDIGIPKFQGWGPSSLSGDTDADSRLRLTGLAREKGSLELGFKGS